MMNLWYDWSVLEMDFLKVFEMMFIIIIIMMWTNTANDAIIIVMIPPSTSRPHWVFCGDDDDGWCR